MQMIYPLCNRVGTLNLKVRLPFAAGCTTGWAKRFEYSYNKEINEQTNRVEFSRVDRVVIDLFLSSARIIC